MSEIITIKWPWTMLPLACADKYIEHLSECISPGHPLYGKKVFPSCRREDTQDLIVQYDLDDEGTYAIVYFNSTKKYGKKKMPKVELFATRSEIKKRFEKDHL